MNRGYVYIMTNKRRTVLYTGVTSDLVRRVAEHKAGCGSAFARRNKCVILVYYVVSDSIESAITQEKRIKNRRRVWKNALISLSNPVWADLSESIGVTPDIVEQVRRSRVD